MWITACVCLCNVLWMRVSLTYWQQWVTKEWALTRIVFQVLRIIPECAVTYSLFLCCKRNRIYFFPLPVSSAYFTLNSNLFEKPLKLPFSPLWNQISYLIILTAYSIWFPWVCIWARICLNYIRFSMCVSYSAVNIKLGIRRMESLTSLLGCTAISQYVLT